jgi:hypothetical protein
MIEFRVFIPVASNDGTVFPPKHHAAFEAEVLRLCGGFSLLSGIVSGAWLGKDATYTDNSRVYVVAVGSVFEAGQIREIAEFALGLYEQESIYVGYLGFSELVTR